MLTSELRGADPHASGVRRLACGRGTHDVRGHRELVQPCEPEGLPRAHPTPRRLRCPRPSA